MSALVREAAITALKEHMNLKPLEVPMKEVTGLDQLSSPTTTKACVVEMKHFLQALVKLKPSVSAKVRTNSWSFFFPKHKKKYPFSSITVPIIALISVGLLLLTFLPLGFLRATYLTYLDPF